MSPKVSVCMVTYNHEPFVAQAIESVLEQSVDFTVEIVVGEDCSMDGTRKVVERLQRRHPKAIRLLARDENLGAHRNFRDTFDHCRGEYVALLDGDDYWSDPGKLSHQIADMEANPEMALSYHGVEVKTDSGTLIRRQPPLNHRPIASATDLLKRRGLAIQTCSVVLRRRLVGPFPSWICQAPQGDWPLYVHSASRGSVGYIDRTMAVYRLHPGGEWSSESWVDRLGRAIANERFIREHVEPQYRPLLDRRIGWTHANLSIAHAVQGDRAASQEVAQTCLRTYPSIVLRNPLLAGKMLAFSHAPRLTAVAKRMMRRAAGPSRQRLQGSVHV